MSIANNAPSPKPSEPTQASAQESSRNLPASKESGPRKKRKLLPWMGVATVIAVLGAAAGWYWWQEQLHALPPGIASANGRLEAEQVQIATKYPGRIAAILVKEGDMVEAGQVLARMDTAELEAQLQSANADVLKAQHEETQAEALIVQRDSERTFAGQELQRTASLVAQGWSTQEKLDQRRSEMKTAEAAYDTAIATRDAARAAIAAGQAEVTRIASQISDSTLVAPLGGRIQYKLAQPGEVLPAGGRVLTLLDLSDVYLTIFLPAHEAGPLALGDDARVVLDPLPGFVFPAIVTFVATEAQFTPKMVETPEEREKLMFRVKLSIDPELRTRYENQVKTGIRGVGFVQTEPDVGWPDRLAIKLP